MIYPPTETLRQWSAKTPAKVRIRDGLRDLILRGLTVGRQIDHGTTWVRFPFYHHVFPDEREGFKKQLLYLRQFGEFISLDEAIALFNSGDPVKGRYFCLTFDDGFKSCISGALPILKELNIPVTFFIVTSLVGKSLAPDDPIARTVFGFKGDKTSLDFMSWEDCRQAVEAGMTIGSHTQTHPRLAKLTATEVTDEMASSKEEIETQIGQPCQHFCAPYGIAGKDFNQDRDPKIAFQLGYKSFLTGHRGQKQKGGNPMAVQRDQLMANWGIHQLRYFFFRN